ncbi:MAG: radical SAM family heme chaperone HemW [Candidatus Krumholzibacteria bacterium]|nr:radical SAM family heme chaperone HemW [Candidatus Krumholzibacteria bacterium]
MMQERSPGLYVHVPFCASKCGYCDFYSVVNPGAVAHWLDAVSLESKIYKDLFPPFGTLYVGGGTPSLLGRPDLERLVRNIIEMYTFEAGFEFTLEANPDDLTQDKLGVLKDLGVNRLSIGVQSFDDAELRLLGRRHDAASALGAVEAARRAGFENIGIDLIYAIPGQTERSLRATLERTLSFEPEHISCYELTLEPEAPLARAIERGEVGKIDEDAGRDLFMIISDVLGGRGYIHYEVSNYARDEGHRSRHNTRYWDHTPYLGLGPSAHSFAAGVRWWNLYDVDSYCSKLNGGEVPVEGSESLSEGQILLERLYFGFRTADGLPLDFFDSLPDSRETLAELELTSLVRIEKSRVIPTLRGFLLSERLPLLFSAD